jgi:hypothetical protein
MANQEVSKMIAYQTGNQAHLLGQHIQEVERMLAELRAVYEKIEEYGPAAVRGIASIGTAEHLAKAAVKLEKDIITLATLADVKEANEFEAK